MEVLVIMIIFIVAVTPLIDEQPACMENATLSIKGFKTNEPVFLECTLGYHDDERFARRMRMCLKLNDTDTDDTVCVLTSDLLPDIVVNKSGHSPNEGRITTIMSVRITNPERREVYLWCCYISDNKTVVADMENYLLENSVKTPSEDDLVVTTGNDHATTPASEIQTQATHSITTYTNTANSNSTKATTSLISIFIVIIIVNFL